MITIIGKMKIQIRQSVFETNSSSTHVLCLCSDEDYIRFKNGQLLFDDGDLIELDDPKVIRLKEKYPDDWDIDFKTWMQFFDTDYETFMKYFTTKSGEKIVAFGYYKYDG